MHRLVTVNQVYLQHFSGTFLLPWFLRIMGASVGRGVVLRSVCFTDFDLIDIGDNSVIGDVSSLFRSLCIIILDCFS